MKYISGFSILCATAIIAVGCATPTSQELKQAESSYSQVQNSPKVTQNAPVALHEAKQNLDKAKQADNIDMQKHYAYLAQKQIELAQTEATHETIREQAAQLKQEQENFLLAVRQREAQQAKQQARSAQEQLRSYRTQQQQQELSQAQQQAQQSRQELEQLRQQLSDMKSKQTQSGVVLTLSDVVFAFNKANLKSGAELSLRRLADFLKQHPDQKILVEGFTDNIGSASYNQQLSQERANAVATALQADGVSASRITTRGLGENYPIAPNDTEAGRQQNRRVEITVLNPGENPGNVSRNTSGT